MNVDAFIIGARKHHHTVVGLVNFVRRWLRREKREFRSHRSRDIAHWQNKKPGSEVQKWKEKSVFLFQHEPDIVSGYDDVGKFVSGYDDVGKCVSGYDDVVVILIFKLIEWKMKNEINDFFLIELGR